MDEKSEKLYAALVEATMSLETIDEQAGKDECLHNITQIRGYAHNRARVARQVIGAYDAARHKQPAMSMAEYMEGVGVDNG